MIELSDRCGHLKLQMQSYLVFAITWFLSWLDQPSTGHTEQVVCNCTCEVSPVKCEISSWGWELIKAITWLSIGLAVGFGKLTLSLIVTILQICVGLVANKEESRTDFEPVPAVNHRNPRQPAIEADVRDRAREQLSLIRQRRGQP